jgi:hypothetical protein
VGLVRSLDIGIEDLDEVVRNRIGRDVLVDLESNDLLIRLVELDDLFEWAG